MNLELAPMEFLGLRVKDRVTGLKGIVTSISFDLFGCIQALVHPGMDKDKKLRDMHWMDLTRLEVQDAEPVMDLPNFTEGRQAEGKQGAAEKPKPNKA